MKPHKRFLLFGMDKNPGGGFDDFLDSYHTLEEAEAIAKIGDYEWYQIYDREEGVVIPV